MDVYRAHSMLMDLADAAGVRRGEQFSAEDVAQRLVAIGADGWRFMTDPHAKLDDVILHINTGHDTDGIISWMHVIGRWEGQWNGSGLKNMSPSYWSPIPTVPQHLRTAKQQT